MSICACQTHTVPLDHFTVHKRAVHHHDLLRDTDIHRQQPEGHEAEAAGAGAPRSVHGELQHALGVGCGVLVRLRLDSWVLGVLLEGEAVGSVAAAGLVQTRQQIERLVIDGAGETPREEPAADGWEVSVLNTSTLQSSEISLLWCVTCSSAVRAGRTWAGRAARGTSSGRRWTWAAGGSLAHDYDTSERPETKPPPCSACTDRTSDANTHRQAQ